MQMCIEAVLYHPDEIKTLSGLEIVRKRPELYLGSNGPTPESICSKILEGALILGSKFAVARCIDDWWFVASEIDWMSPKYCGKSEISELFTSLASFPEAGVNAIRAEVFTSAFSSVLIIGGTSGKLVLKGKKSEVLEFDRLVELIQPNTRVLGFKFESGTYKTGIDKKIK